MNYSLHFIGSGGGGGEEYTKVTSGSSTTTTRINSKEECETAAKKLGFSDTTATPESDRWWPSGCYIHEPTRGLYYNTHSSQSYGRRLCSSRNICISKTSKQSPLTSLQFSLHHHPLVLITLSSGGSGGQMVSCGNHEEPTCAQCPGGHGPSWCNGDCKWRWRSGQCVPK